MTKRERHGLVSSGVASINLAAPTLRL